MASKRHEVRGKNGRFARRPGPGTELKRGRGGRASGRPQVRAKHKRALTLREIEDFLGNLAETCNVALSAREVGRPTRNFYDLRRRDPGFRAAWAEALHEGYERLEMELLHRLRFGTKRDVFHRGRKTATTRVFNDAMALRLLHFHAKTVAAMRAADSGRAPDAEAIFDQLAARVAEIKAEAAAKARESGDEQG